MKTRLSSALIIEDDSDWDVSFKDRLNDFARGSRFLSEQSSNGATPHSPYGDNWDMLWLGHCAITECPAYHPHTSSDHSGSPPQRQRYLLENDHTVPLPGHRFNIGTIPDLSSYADQTRAVFRADGGICLYAYALSFLGAQKVLRAQAVRKTWAPIDVGFSEMCLDTATPFNCIGVFPQLVESHKTAGRLDRDSDNANFSHDDIRELASTANIVYPTRVNVERLLKGDAPLSQWPEEAEVIPAPGGVRPRVVELEPGKALNIVP